MRGNSDRFYVNEGLGEDLLCIEDRQLIRQWKKVMRLKEGDVVRLFDGSGFEYKYQISNIKYSKQAYSRGGPVCPSGNLVVLRLIYKKYFEGKKNKIYLGFGILKDQARMEWMMEKCTELGVDGFVPLKTDNCQIIRNKKQETRSKLKRQDRLEKKIIEACEQSGRVRVPEIMKIAFVNKVLESVGAIHELPVRVVVMEKGSQESSFKYKGSSKGSLCDDNKKNMQEKNILILVGPEGGWSEDEIKYFVENEFEFMTVSSNILRAETAAMMGVGVLKI